MKRDSKPPHPGAAKPAQLDFLDLLSGKQVSVPNAVEIAPGLHVGAIPPDAAPKTGFVNFIPLPDGTLQMVAKTFRPHLKLTKNIASQLGIQCGGEKESRSMYFTIKRLMWAGLVKHKRMGSSYLLDLDSFWRYYTNCGKRGFWTKERSEKYKAARYGPDAMEDDDSGGKTE